MMRSGGGGGLTDKAIGLGAIGYLLDMVTSGVTSSMRAAGGGGFRVSESLVIWAFVEDVLRF